MLKKAPEKYWNHISNIFGFIYLEKMFYVYFERSAFDLELMTVPLTFISNELIYGVTLSLDQFCPANQFCTSSRQLNKLKK